MGCNGAKLILGNLNFKRTFCGEIPDLRVGTYAGLQLLKTNCLIVVLIASAIVFFCSNWGEQTRLIFTYRYLNRDSGALQSRLLKIPNLSKGKGLQVFALVD